MRLQFHNGVLHKNGKMHTHYLLTFGVSLGTVNSGGFVGPKQEHFVRTKTSGYMMRCLGYRTSNIGTRGRIISRHGIQGTIQMRLFMENNTSSAANVTAPSNARCPKNKHLCFAYHCLISLFYSRTNPCEWLLYGRKHPNTAIPTRSFAWQVCRYLTFRRYQKLLLENLPAFYRCCQSIVYGVEDPYVVHHPLNYTSGW